MSQQLQSGDLCEILKGSNVHNNLVGKIIMLTHIHSGCSGRHRLCPHWEWVGGNGWMASHTVLRKIPPLADFQTEETQESIPV